MFKCIFNLNQNNINQYNFTSSSKSMRLKTFNLFFLLSFAVLISYYRFSTIIFQYAVPIRA